MPQISTRRRAARAWLELARPPNVATAVADVLAGFAIAGLADWRALPWLLVSSACLYAGGITLNDVFDRDLDRVERPERPIPSGRVAAAHAGIGATILLTVGTAAAFAAGATAGLVALVIVVLVVSYNGWVKHRPIIGPINMGLCRGANLLLGAAILPGRLSTEWPVAALPVAYIAGVTLVGRGEVAGGARTTGRAALALVVVTIAGLTVLSLRAQGSVVTGVLLTMILAWRVIPAFYQASRSVEPGAARRAVVAGVLSLVLLDAVIAASYAGMIYSLALLATAFLAGRLARSFAVT